MMTDTNHGHVTRAPGLRTIVWSEDGHYYAAINDLPGCVGDGPTLLEAIEDCRLAALEWLDEAKRIGRLS